MRTALPSIPICLCGTLCVRVCVCRENFTFTLHLNCEKFIILISNGEGEDVPVHALKNYTGTEDSLI